MVLAYSWIKPEVQGSAENARQYARLVRKSVELENANKALEQLSRHDGLTDLANRRFFDGYLSEQVVVAPRSCCHRPSDMAARYGG